MADLRSLVLIQAVRRCAPPRDKRPYLD